jgi:hypothetical protein
MAEGSHLGIEVGEQQGEVALGKHPSSPLPVAALAQVQQGGPAVGPQGVHVVPQARHHWDEVDPAAVAGQAPSGKFHTARIKCTFVHVRTQLRGLKLYTLVHAAH